MSYKIDYLFKLEKIAHANFEPNYSHFLLQDEKFKIVKQFLKQHIFHVKNHPHAFDTALKALNKSWNNEDKQARKYRKREQKTVISSFNSLVRSKEHDKQKEAHKQFEKWEKSQIAIKQDALGQKFEALETFLKKIKESKIRFRPRIYDKQEHDHYIYLGMFKNDHPWSKGIYFYENGDIYIGCTTDGSFSGNGCFFREESKERFEGTFKYATETSAFSIEGYFYNSQFGYKAQGEYYKGHWGKIKGRKSQGTYIYSNGDKYSGAWKHNSKDGQGTLEYVNKCKYTGSWQKDMAHGDGMMEYNNRAKYKGQFSYGKKHGQGVYSSGDGRTFKYAGQWKNDKFHGNGTYWANPANDEQYYVGEFYKGKKSGYGKYYFDLDDSACVSYEGQFENDKRNGKGRMIYGNGDVYTGDWYSGKKHGIGTYRHKGKNSYEGYWYEGKKQGKGLYIWLDNDNKLKYNGKWENDNMDGNGTIFYGDGRTVTGTFVMGKLIGS